MQAGREADLVVERLSIRSVPDYGGQAAKAHHAPIQLCHPLLFSGAAAAAGAALGGVVFQMNGTCLLLPE